jgi:serine/threonine protein kinase/tetratricopeptide (TPR) repeat protein/TolB-like protein
MVECPSCHTSNPPESRLCSKCSAPFGIDSATLVMDATPPPPLDPEVTQVLGQVSFEATGIGAATGWSVPIQRPGSANPYAPVEEGAILGERYEILKRLGEGGMGAVYKARDHELDRLVALKVIRPELAGHPDILRRFKQELILARQVTHKNVVRIFDLGTADGRKFITMDYIEGRDLKSILLERGKLPPDEVVPIFQQICRGLEAAHVEGVVHRDLKPQNIMLDQTGRVWLMDFGLARSMEMAGLTRTGVLMGTPDYMSPEQARAEKVDARSDLFSLGIIVYEMLIGQLPFQAETLMAKLLQRVQQRATPVTEIDPSIPAPLGAAVGKCLEPKVANRYQSVREILDDLSGNAQATVAQGTLPMQGTQMTSAGSIASAISPQASSISLTELGPGSQFGPRYRIESEIGEGGMGKVFKAYDIDLDRTVALKLVRPELAKDASSLQRFKQELLLASSISHRNVLRIHDLGDVGGLKFISMAYVQGMDLHELIAKMGKLPTERVLNIAKQLASALEAAHTEGVVHRDLKPRNVLITVDDHVCVSDFGLAKSLDAETTAMTRAGEVLGTPRYMSPEQAESKAADHRSDLYSLGVILYEIATGEVPFTGESSLQVMYQHVQQAPKDPRLINPDVPEYLATIILKCLEKDPALRYQSATELLHDLESSTPPTRIVRLRIAETGYPKWMFAAMAVVLLVGIGLAVRPVRERVLGHASIITGRKRAASRADDKFIALMPLRLDGKDSTLNYEAEGILDAISGKLSPMKNVHLASAAAVEKINAGDPVTKIARQLGSKLIVQGTMQGAADKIQVTLSLSDAKGRQLWTKDFSGVRQDLLTIEDQIYNELVTALELKPSDEELAHNAMRPTENVDAYELYLKGRDILRGKRDVKRVQSAVDLYEQAIKKDSGFALAYAGLSDASLIMYNLNQDATWSQKSLSAAQHAQTLNDEIPEVHFALGNVYRATGKTTEAIVEIKRALELAPNSDEGYRRLADAYLGAGKEDDALGSIQQAIDANPYYWLNYNKLGGVYLQLGQNEKAMAAFRRVVELAPDSALGYENLGIANFLAGKWNDAIVAYGKALKIEPSESLYINLGTAYFYLGHLTDAVTMFQKAVDLNPNDHVAAGDLADGFRWSGQKAKAKAMYEHAITLAYTALRVNPQDASTLGYLAFYYAKNGDSKKGLDFIRRARTIDANDNELMYKEAVVYAIAGQQTEALASLRAAFQKGYPVEQAKNDPELKVMATNPELDKLIASSNRTKN